MKTRFERDQLSGLQNLETLKLSFPEKFPSLSQVFLNIRRGDRIFVGSGCAEPLYLMNSFYQYMQENPHVIFDAEVLNIWSLGLAPYESEKFKDNFRHNTFFVGPNTRSAS
ncbi:MAG: acetyl-CoA hydrolase, partial [Syntrophales bacterium LBB04]|nr:acetyl-CoA hydrolase [Syntrophales bacterium LBB04]